MTYRATTFALLLLALTGSASQGMAQGCVSDQQQFRQLQGQGLVVSFPEALHRAGYSANELAGGPQLCRSGDGYVYRVKVVRNGQVSVVSIPAH